jgi:low affinity Fe/Cu permease
MARGRPEDSRAHRSRLNQRTAQLRFASKVLYWIEHYSSLPAVAITVMVAVVCLLGMVAALNSPGRLVTAFEVVVSAITLVMVFAIQHTQGREQVATQPKLGELLRALPGADAGLMMLEEAPQ